MVYIYYILLIIVQTNYIFLINYKYKNINLFFKLNVKVIIINVK